MNELAYAFYSRNGDVAVSIGCDRDAVRENARMRDWKLARLRDDIQSDEEGTPQEPTPPNGNSKPRGGEPDL